jgi:hypothetical protein
LIVVAAVVAMVLIPMQSGRAVDAPATEVAVRPPAARLAAKVRVPQRAVEPLADEGETFTWDPWVDFLLAPNQANPGPDRYGNPDVWNYLAGPSLDHDPAGYLPMPDYVVDSPTYEKWTYPHDRYHLIAHVRSPDELQMHTGEGWLSILGWRSPMDGAVTVEGTVRLRGDGCEDVATGIIFSVDLESRILYRVVMNEPGQATLSVPADVRVGESLYFVLDPGQDTNCDTTVLSLLIAGTGAIPDTAMAAPE